MLNHVIEITFIDCILSWENVGIPFCHGNKLKLRFRPGFMLALVVILGVKRPVDDIALVVI